jgi:hypothetical protein
MPTNRTLICLAWILAICLPALAQDAQDTPPAKTISVQLRDGRNGTRIAPSNLLLRIDHHDTIHSEWVTISDNGTMTVTVPDDAKELSIQATYGDGMDTYINCDVARQSDKEREIWYPIDRIMTTGAVAPNECSKMSVKPKPGVFVLFVRKRSAFDRLHNTDEQ